jgi:hypothetical protein
MIKILESKTPTEKIKPYYLLVYNYMIGDDDGNTTEEVTLSAGNPYIERYCTVLNSLKPTEGTWGLMLSQSDIRKCYEEKQISQDDFEFLKKTMFEDGWQNEETGEEVDDYMTEFADGVSSDTEYSFLVFEGVDLYFIDEYNKKHETVFEKEKSKTKKKKEK